MGSWLCGNLAADSELLEMPSMVKSRMSSSPFRLKKHMLIKLSQSEWDDYPHKKLHEIFSKLNGCISCPWSNRREDRLSIDCSSQSCTTHSFLILLKGEESPDCVHPM